MNLHFSSLKKKKTNQETKIIRILRQQVLLLPSKTLSYQKKKNVEKQLGKSKTHGLQRFEYNFFPKVTLARIPCFAKPFYYAKKQLHICWIFLSKSKYASKVLLESAVLGFLQFRIYLFFGWFFFNT